MRSLLRAVSVAALCSGITAGAPHQASLLIVQVGDADTGAFITDADVHLPSIRRSARTQWDGEARFPGLATGRYRVQVRAIGYAPGEVDVSLSGDTLPVHFRLERVPAVVDTVRVSATRESRWLGEFNLRRQIGLGRFLTDSAIAEHASQGLPMMLATQFPGFRLTARGIIANDGAQGGECGVLFYLDGFRLGQSLLKGGSSLDLDTIVPQELAGIEVYSRTTAPPQYKSLGDYCKIVLLWTKR